MEINPKLDEIAALALDLGRLLMESGARGRAVERGLKPKEFSALERAASA